MIPAGKATAPQRLLSATPLRGIKTRNSLDTHLKLSCDGEFQ